MTVGEALSGRDNALNFVRLCLALLVIVEHTSVGGFGVPQVGGVALGQMAVGGFFALSGFLIARSRVALPLGVFLWHRALRIFPAFWVCLAVVAFVLAPGSTLRTGLTWEPSSAVGYVVKNAGLWTFQPGIDNTLPPLAFPWWNGSLWTLPWEFAAYLACALVLTFTVAKVHRFAAMSALLVLVTVVQWFAVGPWDVGNSHVLAGLQLASFFVAGMWVWAVSDRLPVSTVLAVSSVAVFVVLLAVGWAGVLGQLPVAYFCLWAGATLPTRIGNRNDISYGMYVYAFPIQHGLAMGGLTEGGIVVFALASALATTPFAWASWLLVEKPALRYRHAFGRATTKAPPTSEEVGGAGRVQTAG